MVAYLALVMALGSVQFTRPLSIGGHVFVEATRSRVSPVSLHHHQRCNERVVGRSAAGSPQSDTGYTNQMQCRYRPDETTEWVQRKRMTINNIIKQCSIGE